MTIRDEGGVKRFSVKNRLPFDSTAEAEALLIADTCPDVLWSYNLDKKRWNYISPSIGRLCGFSVEETMELDLDQLMTPASYRYLTSFLSGRLEQYLKDESRLVVQRDEIELVRKDGSTVLCEVASRYIRNNSGVLTLAGVAREVKKRSEVEKELRASEEKYREILGSIEEGYYETDLKGRLTFFNDAACRMLGYSREEFSELSYKKLYKNPEAVVQKFKSVYITGQPENGFTIEMARKDNGMVYVEISISPMRERDGKLNGFRGVARDISERVKFQQQLEYFSMHDQLTGLYNRTYFEEEMRRLSKSRDYPVTMIMADLNGLKIINDSLGHDYGDRLLKAAAAVMQDSLRGSDVLARVGGDEYSAILVNADERVALKIIARIRKKIKIYCEQNPDLYLSLSLGTATAPDNSVTFTELFKLADDAMYRDKFAPSTSARNKIMQSLMDALAEKDYITGGHTKRLEIICRKMGDKMGLSTRQQDDLALLAQVHDLGKVGIPEKIIFKEGPLTPAEWRIMRQHPEKGYRIALSSKYLSGVANLILKHHERWDGNGYPLGLRGVEIPLECRILMVADAYDAMTNARPYSMAKSKEEALQELEICKGHQFDPDVVHEFAKVVRKNSQEEQSPR